MTTHCGNYTELAAACRKHGIDLMMHDLHGRVIHRPIAELHAGLQELGRKLGGLTISGTAAMSRRELELAAEGHGVFNHGEVSDQLLAQAVDNRDKARDLTDNTKTTVAYSAVSAAAGVPKPEGWGTPNGPGSSAP